MKKKIVPFSVGAFVGPALGHCRRALLGGRGGHTAAVKSVSRNGAQLGHKASVSPLRSRGGVEITGLFNTEELGSSTYRLNLFGWLPPLSEVVVDVVPPLIQVFPGGQSIGVLLSSDGLVVSQVGGGVLGLDGEEYFPARDGALRPVIFYFRLKATHYTGQSKSAS